MLTASEIEAARSAENFGLGWGQVRDGKRYFCPASAVAVARGVTFSVPKGSPGESGLTFLTPRWDDEVFYGACKDVAEWLGFATWDDYARALQIERKDILKRAMT